MSVSLCAGCEPVVLVTLSLIIAFWTSVAFASGAVLAWCATGHPRVTVAVRVTVMTVAIIAAVFFFFSHSSRYALLLPLAVVTGCFSVGQRRLAPAIFDQHRQAAQPPASRRSHERR